MCGICGFVFEDKQLAKRMASLITHRGPDDSAVFCSDVTLAMNRLSIVDLQKGLYPIHNEEETVFVVFNGEIYNHKELRKELDGHEFYTDCDAEVIVHLYEEYGKDFVKHLNGMFAIALYDSERKTLLIARDRLGIKPLYYTKQNFAFASEAKCLLLNHEKGLNYTALHDYLSFRCNSTSETFFTGIYKLKPGHLLVVDSEGIHEEKYWDYRISLKNKKRKVIEKEILKRLKKSIQMRLMSDVPLGAYISGGVDSGSIVALMSEFVEEPVKTYSVVFTEEEELEGAKFIADHYNTEHHEIVVDVDTVDVLPKIVWHLDEPMCDPTCIPMYMLARETKKSATVVLTGDGSDEQFAGYEQFKLLHLRKKYGDLIPYNLRKIVPNLVDAVPDFVLDSIFKYASSLGDKGMERFSNYFVSNKKEEMYMSVVSIFGEDEKKALYTKNINDSIDYQNYWKNIQGYFRNRNDFIAQLLRLDSEKMLSEDILMKTDKNNMAWSVEARVPFLDHTLWEYSMTIDSRLKIRKAMDKYILRRSLSKVLPKKVTGRKKDRFFVPIDDWIAEDMKEMAYTLLDEKSIKSTGVFDYDYIEKIKRGFNESRLYYARQLWALICFQLWHKIYLERDFTKKSSLRF